MFPLLSFEFTVSIAQTGENVKRGKRPLRLSLRLGLRLRHLSRRARQENRGCTFFPFPCAFRSLFAAREIGRRPTFGIANR